MLLLHMGNGTLMEALKVGPHSARLPASLQLAHIVGLVEPVLPSNCRSKGTQTPISETNGKKGTSSGGRSPSTPRTARIRQCIPCAWLSRIQNERRSDIRNARSPSVSTGLVLPKVATPVSQGATVWISSMSETNDGYGPTGNAESARPTNI